MALKHGISKNNGFPERANIIVDEDGKIVFFKIYDIPELLDIEEIINFIKKLGGAYAKTGR